MNRPKLKILFDGGPLVNGHKSGVGYYTYQLVEALAKHYPNEVELTGHYFNFLGRKQPELPTAPNISYKISRLLPGKVLSLLRRVGLQLPFELLIKKRGDIALFPNFVSLPTATSIKKVIVIHDLCFENHPEYLQPANRRFLKQFVPRSVKTADLVIAVSDFTKESVKIQYHISDSHLLVTTIPPFKPTSGSQPKNLVVPDKYILFVGTLEPRKNYLALARAYALLPDNLKQTYGLVLAGGPGWESEAAMAEIKRLADKGNNIVITGYVDEPTRAYLYKNASLFATATHYEGFGMPILEAMSYGVPTAVSDIPVFREVAGNAAAYFNKDDIDDIAACFLRLLNDPKHRKGLTRRGTERLKIYSWKKVADAVMSRFIDLSEGKS